MERLLRIELLVLSLTTVATVVAAASEVVRPLGIAFGGGMALLDLWVIRRLGAAALGRQAAVGRLVPLAFVKSLALLAVPAVALWLPSRMIDGVSFALGVTALPVAIVLDALTPIATRGER